MTTGRRSSFKAAALMALAASCAQAWAHAYLQRSEPPANVKLDQLPAELRLRFSEAVEPAFIELRVLRNGQAMVTSKLPQVAKDGKTVQLALPATTTSAVGDYEVHWRIVAKDGHPTEGRYTFRVGAR